MKRRKRLPIPQKEFGFTTDTFNLFQEVTGDGESVSREREEIEIARELAETAQTSLFQPQKTGSSKSCSDKSKGRALR